MGLISSIFRFISSVLGQAEGKTERVNDKIITSSPDAIRNQYRKTKENWTRDKNEMEIALAKLVSLKTDKENEVIRLRKLIGEMETKKQGAITQFKAIQDEQYKTFYSKCALACEEAESKIAHTEQEIQEQAEVINTYIAKLRELTEEIKNLDREENETIADMVSMKKINEINKRLQGISNTTHDKNLDAIREERKQIKAATKLNAEISGTADKDFEKKLLATGKISKHMDAFDEAVKLDKIFIGSEPVKELPKPKNNLIVDAEIIPKDTTTKKPEKPLSGVDKLFS